MEAWGNCNIPELDYEAVATSSFDDDEDWDPTEITPPVTRMNLGFDTAVGGRDIITNTSVSSVDYTDEFLCAT